MRSATGPKRAPFVLGALVLAAAFAGVYVFFVRTHTGQLIDERSFEGAALWRGGLGGPASWLLNALPAISVGLAFVIMVIVSIIRRNGTVFIAAAAAALAANASTQLLKYAILDRPDTGVAEGLANSLPSGHTTAAASAALAVFLIASPRMRPVAAAIGSLFAIVAGAATLVNQWHRPSDVIAALLVVAFWGCGAGFVLATSASAQAARPSRTRALPLAIGALLCAVAAGFGFVVTAGGLAVGSNHRFIAYMGGVAAIAAIGLALAWAGVMLFRWLR
ncbi:phosphatase PAP2 family protein [Microbacterium sp. STN6]|uniref:phosphatase PAP2 family protein n=1 Tax=Microbacterium sp. STN6 TaxID=2995588 RepID=UPI002260C1B2|nr:phosphatase PAP2 family protein [Microbacterium sp. STN6]MCX7522498.1 phosphatase PAP2 family protein [Microbacterium sp. STN6]